LKEFHKYYKVGDATKETTLQNTLFYRRLSCMFPGIADLTRNGNSMPPFLNKLYKKLVYGDEDNYKLKNVEH